jgi:hypothetical protein
VLLNGTSTTRNARMRHGTITLQSARFGRDGFFVV